jgi:hypothetical protein
MTRRAIVGFHSRIQKAHAMAFESLKLQISLLLTQMQNEPEDRHEIYLQLREKLNEMKAFGMPLPEDLLKMERDLEVEFASEQPGDD